MNSQGSIILSCPSCGATQRLEEHENVITCNNGKILKYQINSR